MLWITHFTPVSSNPGNSPYIPGRVSLARPGCTIRGVTWSFPLPALNVALHPLSP